MSAHLCILHETPGRVWTALGERATVGPQHVVVRAELTGVSPGTELRMLSTAEGSNVPYVPGYCVAGRVMSGGKAAGLEVGQRVLCPGGETGGGLARGYGGHQAVHVVPGDSVLVVPEGLSAEAVVLNKLASIAHRGMVAGRAAAGQRVLVVGLGVVGQLAARLWHEAGARVTAADRIAFRREVAAAAGIDVAADLAAAGTVYDAVVDCTGVPAVMAPAMRVLRQDPWTGGDDPGPTYVLQGSYAGEVSFAYREAFQRQVTMVVPRDSTISDQGATLALIAAGRLRLDDLLTRIADPADAADTYAALSRPETNDRTLGVAFRWPSG
ncbi:MAG: hypothetical protein AAF800_00920 [Planctomycetota bacterium]